jgi:alpha-glucuronidase
MWKETLDFDMHAGRGGTPVKELVAGRVFDRPTGGFVGVANVGRDENWLGHHLAMANLYAFGRLAWDADLSSERIAEEWTRQTFGSHPKVVGTIVDMLMRSWPIYESYTGPLGIGTLTDIIHIHFGPAPESSEYNGWGQWHRASETGVGMNRTVATGTGFTAQYRRTVAERFESLETCPDDLLLFFHHVPYTHVLESGKTVIQHFYDTHYDGAEQAAGLVEAWRGLAGLVDERRHCEVLERLEYQAGHAQVWRDSICNWFHRKSGIADERGRVGNHPHRFEAEQLELSGYRATAIEPWEAASGGEGVEVPAGSDAGEVRLKYEGEPGWFEVRVQYFDEEDGVSTFEAWLNDQRLDRWIADQHVPTPTTKPDAHSSIRRTNRGVPLRRGDVLRIVGGADRDERAVIDYLELIPETTTAMGTGRQAD